MRVVFVNHYAIPPDAGGGTRHFSLARELIKRGHETLIVASSFNHFSRSQQVSSGNGSELRTFDGVPFLFVRVPEYSSNNAGRARNMLEFGVRAASLRLPKPWDRAQAIVGSTPHPFAALAALRQSKRVQSAFVLEVRDIWPASLVDLAGYSETALSVRALGRIERYLCRRACRIVSLLEFAHDHFSKFGVRDERVVFIPNGVDFNLAPNPRPAISRGGPFRVLYAGSMGPPNALDAVLDAARILGNSESDVSFELMGEGVDRGRLEKRLKGEGIANVVFSEPIPKKDVYGRMQEADALIINMPSSDLYRAGMSSNKLCDYMAAARPIVFGVAGQSDVVAEAGAGISVPAEDAQALAAAVRRLMDMSPEARWGLGRAGRRWLEANRGIADLASRFEATIAECVGELGESHA